MSEMVDRVAKAIINADLGSDCWDSLPEELFDEYLGMARAAIEAMRDDPTEDMNIAAQQSFIRKDGGTITSMWKAMISAALT